MITKLEIRYNLKQAICSDVPQTEGSNFHRTEVWIKAK